MIDDECWENMAPPLDDTPAGWPRAASRPIASASRGGRSCGSCSRDEHVDDIVGDEEDRIVAFAAVCSPTIGAHPEQMGGAVPRLPRGAARGRKVLDALTGRELPYRNIWAELEEEYGLHGDGAEEGDVR